MIVGFAVRIAVNSKRPHRHNRTRKFLLAAQLWRGRHITKWVLQHLPCSTKTTAVLSDLVQERLQRENNILDFVCVRSNFPTAHPSCNQIAILIYRYCVRSPHDLPISGQAVQLKLHARRFHSSNAQCARQILSKRLPDLVAIPARRPYDSQKSWKPLP